MHPINVQCIDLIDTFGWLPACVGHNIRMANAIRVMCMEKFLCELSGRKRRTEKLPATDLEEEWVRIEQRQQQRQQRCAYIISIDTERPTEMIIPKQVHFWSRWDDDDETSSGWLYARWVLQTASATHIHYTHWTKQHAMTATTHDVENDNVVAVVGEK